MSFRFLDLRKQGPIIQTLRNIRHIKAPSTQGDPQIITKVKVSPNFTDDSIKTQKYESTKAAQLQDDNQLNQNVHTSSQLYGNQSIKTSSLQSQNHHSRITSLEDPALLKKQSKKIIGKNESNFGLTNNQPTMRNSNMSTNSNVGYHNSNCNPDQDQQQFSSSSDGKPLKRKATMPVNSQAQQNSHQNQLLNILHQSQDRTSTNVNDQTRFTAASNTSQPSQAYGTGINNYGGTSSQMSNGSENMIQNTGGSFLPDIYMTTTANGKVSMIAGSKQVISSQTEAAKRLIKKSKQFILVDGGDNILRSSNNSVPSYKRVNDTAETISASQQGDPNCNGYFNNSKDNNSRLQQHSAMGNAQHIAMYTDGTCIEDANSQQANMLRSPGYSQLMRQKNTPKNVGQHPIAQQSSTETKILQSKSQIRPVTKIGQETATNILKTPQQSIDPYYNMVATPKKNSVISLNNDGVSFPQSVSPLLSQQNFHQVAVGPVKANVCDSQQLVPQINLNSAKPQQVNILSQNGKTLTKLDHTISLGPLQAYQSPSTKNNKNINWKVSLEEAINDAAISSTYNNQFNQTGNKDTFSQTAQLQNKMSSNVISSVLGTQGSSFQVIKPNHPQTSTDLTKIRTGAAASSYYQAAQIQIAEEIKESQSKRTAQTTSFNPSVQGTPNIVKQTPQSVDVNKNKQKTAQIQGTQKSIKVVYKQMRESTDKNSKIGNKAFQSMDDQNANNSLAFNETENYQKKLENEVSINNGRPGVNYDQFLSPKTDRVYEFQSKRVDFRRRQASRSNLVAIIHFEGVIGEIMQRNIGDDHYQMCLRHGALDGLKEISKSFQLVIYSMLNEKYCNHIIDMLDREQVAFDGFYQKVKAFKRSDEYCNYNQIYLDFEIIQGEVSNVQMNSSFDQTHDIKHSLVQNVSVQSSVMVVCPICLDNEDIKDREGDQLLYQDKIFSTMQSGKRNLNLRGLPIDSASNDQNPLVFLVPHIRQQLGNYSVSMINISNILTSLLVTACIVKEDQIRDLRQEASKDLEQHFRQIREEERIKQQIQLQMSSNSRSPSPKRQGIGQIKTQNTITQKGGGLFMMTITTISPKNHFKKILATTKDKVLDQKSCNWLQAFYQIKKYKLFYLKTASSMKFIPEYLNKRRDEDCLKLKQTVFKLKALLKAHTDKTNQQQKTQSNHIQSEIIITNPKAQQIMNELVSTNEWARTSVSQYKTDYYKNLMQLLQNHQQASLQDIIKELEDRITEIEAGQQFYSLNDFQGEEASKQPQLLLYRFLVLQGHQFQSYPLEMKQIIKEKDTNLQRNLVNWMMKPTSRNLTKQRNQTNPLNYLNGQSMQQQQSYQIDTMHQFQPGYRIFSDQYQ